ncbi:MAG: hypothetical protein WBL25_04620 [Anaerolineales bacterium]
MLNIAKGVFGGLMLFLGRDMDWLFSLGLGLLVGLKLTTLLETNTPQWMIILVVVAAGAVSILPYLVYPEARFILTGFLFGGFLLSEYGSDLLRAFFGTGLTGSDWMIFIVGAVLGAAVIGLTREWGIMFATALAGAFLVSDIFTSLTPVARYLAAGGLFITGSIVQAIILRMEQAAER